MNNPLSRLRAHMHARGIDAYLIPTADFHASESVGAHFACRAYVSGFTGSNGTLLVLQDWAGLWTDARYFLQAETQLEGSGITLMKQGVSGVPSLLQVLQKRLSPKQTLGFDGRCLSAQWGKLLHTQLPDITLCAALDLVEEIWTDRPPLSAEPAWLLAECYAGETRASKLRRVRREMTEKTADVLLLSTLDDIAWLLNLRGNDITYAPVVLSFLLLTQTEGTLFINPAVCSDDVRAALAADGILLRPYADCYHSVAALPAGQRIWMDRQKLNLALFQKIPDTVSLYNRPLPTEQYKAIKNPIEVKQEQQAHLKDGIALTRFLYWLKHQIGTIPITERSAAAVLEEFRRAQSHYLAPSFAPILAYGAHGAIVHYSATEETDFPLRAEGFLLADTGGHYLEGTTDCTRTIALGALTATQKQHYTAVLSGLLQLADAQFLHGCTGAQLDYLARQPLWAMGLDYQHGTGHGVGYLLNVHEGPQSIHWQKTKTAAFEAGMITSDEPGLYLTGQYGIRLENLLLCEERANTAYGRFLGFSHLTLVPFDADAIEPTQLTAQQRSLLNRYHALVYQQLAPHLPPEESHWLRQVTQAI